MADVGVSGFPGNDVDVGDLATPTSAVRMRTSPPSEPMRARGKSSFGGSWRCAACPLSAAVTAALRGGVAAGDRLRGDMVCLGDARALLEDMALLADSVRGSPSVISSPARAGTVSAASGASTAKPPSEKKKEKKE